MGRVKRGWIGLFALPVMVALTALPVQAQTPGSIPGVGGMTSATSTPLTYTTPPNMPSGTTAAASSPDYTSQVSFIDSALCTSQVKLRFDANYDDREPSRNEYLFAKSGVPGSPGWWTPEKRVDWQELSSYIEVAYQGIFSGFVELPTRWVNPEVNNNNWGMGDINLGLKVAFLTTPGLSTAFEVRGTIPTRAGPGLSTDHYSVEPGFLLYLQAMEMLAIEGEARYWKPIEGSDFSGDMVRYGLGVSLSNSFITPVIEAVGWSVLGGKEMVSMPDGFFIRSSSGETIVNGIAGLRFGLGQGDVYFGYGRSLTGDAWQHEFWRLEFRIKF